MRGTQEKIGQTFKHKGARCLYARALLAIWFAAPLFAMTGCAHASRSSATASQIRPQPLGDQPLLLAVAPSAGPPGGIVTLAGRNFGDTQKSSSVTFNGVPAEVESWSSNFVVVEVPPHAATGSILIKVEGMEGVRTSFTVTKSGMPVISASVFPPLNKAGWSSQGNTTVTFKCTDGGVPITKCPSTRVLKTEGVDQVVTGSVTNSVGTASTSVTLKIDTTPPAVAVTFPTDSMVFSDSEVTVTGTVTDDLSGVSEVTCNFVPGKIVGSDFSCYTELKPGLNLILVRATDAAGNVAAEKTYVSLGKPWPPPTSMYVTPSTASMSVGQTRPFSTFDQAGHPHPESTWTVSDPTVAAFVSDEPGTMLALKPGSITITASIGSVSAQAVVTIYP